MVLENPNDEKEAKAVHKVDMFWNRDSHNNVKNHLMGKKVEQDFVFMVSATPINQKAKEVEGFSKKFDEGGAGQQPNEVPLEHSGDLQ